MDRKNLEGVTWLLNMGMFEIWMKTSFTFLCKFYAVRMC